MNRRFVPDAHGVRQPIGMCMARSPHGLAQRLTQVGDEPHEMASESQLAIY